MNTNLEKLVRVVGGDDFRITNFILRKLLIYFKLNFVEIKIQTLKNILCICLNPKLK